MTMISIEDVGQADLSSRGAVLTAIVLAISGVSFFHYMPQLVGGFQDYVGLTAAQGGFIVSANVAGIAIGSALGFLWVHDASWRMVGKLSLTAAVIGNLLAIPLESAGVLIALRFLIGLASGSTLALAYAMFAATQRPDRNFGLFLVCSLSSGAVVIPAIPYLMTLFGVAAVYLALALIPAIGLFLTNWIPPHGSAHRLAHGGQEKIILPVVIVALLANLVYYIAQGGVWSYLERIATAAGQAASATANALAMSMFAAGMGALLASWLDRQLGRAFPIGFAILLTITSLWLLMGVFSASIFLLAVALFNFANNYGHPYLMGYMAAIDKSGRYVVVSAAMQTGGMALGPLISALVLGADENYKNVLLMGMICLSIALLLFLPIMVLIKGSDTVEKAL